MKPLWSSRDQKFIAHAMSHDEMSTLCDIYQMLHPDFRQKKTSYVLQTLSQDLTSDIDVRTWSTLHKRRNYWSK